MKPFQTILFLAVIILIGGMAALYWGKSVQEAAAPVAVDEQVETIIEPVEETLKPGAYLVFQVDDWFFYRLAVNDIGTTDATRFATLKNPLAVSGGLTAYVYGQNLLLHRYLEEERDGVVSLEGEVKATRPIQWGTLRSANGRYEVVWESVYDAVKTDMVVTDLETVRTLATIPQAAFETSEPVFDAEPFLLDDHGAYLYVREVCACEATVSGLWEVELASGEVTRLDTLAGLESWFQSILDANSRRLLSVKTVRRPAEDGPYDELLPPTTIEILDLDTLQTRELLVDNERAWHSPRLDPTGRDRYLVQEWGEGNGRHLVDFDVQEIIGEPYLTDGWVLDWVGDWLVVQEQPGSSFTLINTQTDERVSLNLPGGWKDYVGAVELK